MDQLKDEATENVVIGSLILNPNEYNSVAHYVTDLNVFSQKRARALWQKITKMIRDDGHIDLITVCASLTQDETTQGATKGYVVECTNNSVEMV